jgi:hypothetical protein
MRNTLKKVLSFLIDSCLGRLLFAFVIALVSIWIIGDYLMQDAASRNYDERNAFMVAMTLIVFGIPTFTILSFIALYILSFILKIRKRNRVDVEN